MPDDILTKVDRASMAYSVEVRSPFLDYRVIEYARNIPVKYRYKNNSRKIILKDILKKYIPENVFNQPKMGFSVPMASWIRNEMKTEILNTLDSDFLKKVPNLDVEKFNQLLDDHMTGKHDNKIYIWRLYVLAKWYEEFGY